TKILEIGSLVDYSSLRSQDLMPAFLELLKDIDDDFVTETLCEIPYDAQLNDTHEFWDSETCAWIMDSIFDRLNEYTPEDYYFGAHEGNGSDFGVWQYDI
ncbi:MAG: hypothetical protein GY823_13660, partial [Flavobacteriaceae bacterium]|nr:hypothetical protein [Flavobacteriaceae bacterium]